MDMSRSIEPNSAQVNAEDLIASPRTVTITSVEAGSSEQPVFVHLAEFPGRTYRPSKSMRRVMVACWGSEASEYTGRRMTIYRDPEISFGKEKVGGIRISALSHIEKPITIALTVSRGKRAQFVVQPITAPTAAPTRDFLAELTLAGDDLDAVRALGNAAIAANAAKDVIQTIRDKSTALSTKPTVADDNEVF